MGTFSVEQLVHFSCAKCTKWWSIASYNYTGESLFCPLCGHQQTFTKAVDLPTVFKQITPEHTKVCKEKQWSK